MHVIKEQVELFVDIVVRNQILLLRVFYLKGTNNVFTKSPRTSEREREREPIEVECCGFLYTLDTPVTVTFQPQCSSALPQASGWRAPPAPRGPGGQRDPRGLLGSKAPRALQVGVLSTQYRYLQCIYISIYNIYMDVYIYVYVYTVYTIW